MKTIINNEIKEIKQETKNNIVKQNNNYFDNNGNLIIEKEVISTIGNRLKALDTIANEIKKALVSGINNDYAIIPGTNKPSLLQPGARKICLMLGLTTSYTNLSCVGNLLTIKCELHYQDKKISESFGAESIQKPNKPERIGWEYNKALKIAQKRAFVGAVLNIANLTKLFTQDMEDSNIAAPKPSVLSQQQKNRFYDLVKSKNNLTGYTKWDILKPLVDNELIKFNQQNKTNYQKIDEFSLEHYNKIIDDLNIFEEREIYSLADIS